MNAPFRPCGVPVVWRERPFSSAEPHRMFLTASPRMPTIAEIVAGCDPLPRHFDKWGEVRINGDRVPRGVWHLVRPRYRPGYDTVVSLHVPLRGGGGGSSSGGGSKSVLATVASIAVLLVAAAVTGGAAGGLIPGFFAAGSVSAAVGAAAIGIGGSLLIAALVPPPTLAPANASGAIAGSNDPASKNASAASLSGNVLSPASAMPRVIGTMRVYPPLICQPLIEVVGDDEFAEAVFGLAGPHQIDEARVGGTLVDSLTEVQAQYVEGRPGDAIQTLVTRQSYTNTTQVELTGHTLDQTTQNRLADQINPATCLPVIQTLTSRKAPDEIWINLAFPEGLFKGDSLTSVINVPVRLRIRRRGADAFINMPEVHFSMNQPGSFQKVIRLKWGAIPDALSQPQPQTNQGPKYVFKNVPGQVTSPSTSGWTADASFSAGSGSDVLMNSTWGTTGNTSNVRNVEMYADKVIFYLDPTAFPQDFYEMQIERGSPYDNASFSTSNYQYSGTVLDFFTYSTSGGFAVIPVDHTQYHDSITVTRVASVWNDNPVQSSDFSTMSLRVHNRQLDSFSVLASGLVPDWDGAGWTGLVATSNPGPHLYDVLTGALGAGALPTAIVDSAGIAAWRQKCIDRGYTVNAVVENKKYPDVISMVCAAGYARIRYSETWGVLIDEDKSAEAPVQVFTPRNMANFQWTRAFTDRPSGIRAGYQDASDDYNTAESFVYDDPDDQDADSLEQISYDGLVLEADVLKRARFDLDQSDLRFTFYSGDADAEAIVCQRGDLVAVQHDTLVKKAGFSRIRAVYGDRGALSEWSDGSEFSDGSGFISGGTIAGLALDGTVPVYSTPGIFSVDHLFAQAHVFDLGQKTGIAIRLKRGSGSIIKEITGQGQGHTTEIRFVTPFADPGDLDEDCLVTVGPLGSEYKRLLVYAVAPKNDFQATLTFVDEAPELWAA